MVVDQVVEVSSCTMKTKIITKIVRLLLIIVYLVAVARCSYTASNYHPAGPRTFSASCLTGLQEFGRTAVCCLIDNGNSR